MLDRIYVTPRPQHVYHRTEATEKRAPTDASVQLLREMEDAAEKQIIKSIKVGNTEFECVVHVVRESMSLDTIYRAIFSLNGKQLIVISRTSDYNTTRQDRMRALVEAIAEKIAIEIVAPALRTLSFG